MRKSQKVGVDQAVSSTGDGVSLPKDIVLPNHVAIIPDGNRRWARAIGLPTIEGHKKGGDRVLELLRYGQKIGIFTFTFWAFSTENWSRDGREVQRLLRGIEQGLDEYFKEAVRKKVRVVHLGRKDRIPASLARKLAGIEETTKNNDKFVFNLAIDYGGHDEILRAVRKIVEDGVAPEKIDEKLFERYLDTFDQPYPYVDLLIRTSGEQRLSGILPWQMEYAEIWWEEAPLPDFTVEKFVEALLDYSRRRRRFGGDGEVKKLDFRPHVLARLELDWWRARKFADRGGFARAFVHYLKEQFGISLSLAREATEIFIKAALLGEEKGEWERARKFFVKFYRFLKNNVKLAFEPSLVASLEVEYLKRDNGNNPYFERHGILRKLMAELFRIPLFQANKAAHLKIIAQGQEEEAEKASGKKKAVLLKRAEDYLIRSYEALKERVA